MKKKSKKGKIILIVLLVLAVVVVGGYFGIQFLKKQNTSVYIEQVSYMNNNWVLMNDSTDGTIMEAATQNEYLSINDQVDMVYVVEGQDVKQGDPLFHYDTQTLELEVEQRRLDVEMGRISLEMAKDQLNQYNKIVPRSAAPEPVIPEVTPYEPTEEEQLGEPLNTPADGIGTNEDPWVYEINAQTLLSSEQVLTWIMNEETVAFVYPDAENGEWHDGDETEDALNGNGVGSSDVTPEPSEKISDVTIHDDEDDPEEPETVPVYWHIDKDTLTQPFEENEWFRVAEKSFWYPPEPEINIDWSAYNEPTYTAEDKARMVRDQQLTVKRLENGLAKAEITLKETEDKLNSSTVTAKMDGTVMKIGDPANPAQDGSAFCTVAATAGATVRGYISELALQDTNIGDQLTVTSWMNGISATATISEIADYPTDVQQWTNGNPNVSFYEYRAVIDSSQGFEVGEGVSISAYQENAQSAIVLMSVYVRNENGENYVMIDDGTGHLKRQPVQIKATSDSMYLQITEGLTVDDYVAFPYGDGNTVGAKTTTEYQFSIF